MMHVFVGPCRYDLADYLEFTDQKASVRAKQRLAVAKGLTDDDSIWAWCEDYQVIKSGQM